MMGKEQNEEGKEGLIIKSMSHLPNREGNVMAWVCMAANGTILLVFIDHVSEDRCSRMNS